jgi:DNA-binding response OmpR family regulator
MLNILVVDDEEFILQLLMIGLNRYGFNVETAVDGTGGIQKFDEGHFDVVITDLCMPGVDGNDLAKYIRNSERQSTPIIGISGTPWLTEKSVFNAVLSKPFSIQSILKTIHNLIEAPSTYTVTG